MKLLSPLSWIYGLIVKARFAAYKQGLFHTQKTDCPVISIGNITTGGTGKTPLVELVARIVSAGGSKCCILTRGFGRRSDSDQVVVSDGSSLLASAASAGDEPRLLAENLIGISSVIVNSDRYKAALWAKENLQSQVFILDDGFQHLKLRRDLDIVAIDATNPFGGKRLLPEGRLREPLDGLSRADLIVVTRSELVNDTGPLVELIRDLSGDKPVFISRTRVVGSFSALDHEALEISSEKVAAFAGIGNPQAFKEQVASLGVEITFFKKFADHYFYRQADVETLEQSARLSGATCLLTTSKDAVKLDGLKFSMRLAVLEIVPEIERYEEFKKIVLSVLG
jgi:tetraacyldisaccharide 4'-kinase